MRASLILVLLLGAGVSTSAGAEPRHRTLSAADKEPQLKEAQRLYEEGDELWKEARYKDAVAPLKQALKIREQLLGSDAVDVATCLNRLGTVYWKQGRYARADQELQRAQRNWESSLGPSHPNVAKALNNRAIIYTDQGRYERAEPLLLHALKIWEAALGPTHPDVALAVNNLANLYKDLGLYDQEEPLRQRALRIFEDALGPNNSYIAASLGNLGNLYANQGQYQRAEPLLQRALRIQEKVLGSEHPDVAASLHNLAILYGDEGQHEQAEQLYRRAIHISEVAQRLNHPELASELNDLASLYVDQGMYDREAPLYQRALQIRKASCGLGHPDIANSLHSLAFLRAAQGQYALAEQLMQRALGIRKSSLGPTHLLVSASLHELALLSSRQGKIPLTVQYSSRAFGLLEEQLRRQSLVLTDDHFASLLASSRNREEDLFSILRQHPNAELARLALAVTLLRKGRTADEAAQFSQAIHRNPVEKDRQQFEDLRVLRSRFSALSLAGPGTLDLARYRKQLENLDAQANNLEEELARRSAPLRRTRSLPGVGQVVDRIANLLRNQSALIELVSFHRRDFHLPPAKQTNELRYLAFVLTHDRHVTAVDLGLAKPIDEAAERLHTGLSDPSSSFEEASRELFNQLIKPLLPALGSSKRLILSLDGQLHLVPFDVLHDGTGMLGDGFQISYVTSGRDLLPHDLGRVPATDAVVFADPDFGTPVPQAGGEQLAPDIRRGPLGLHPDHLSPLPGTRKEAAAIQRILPSARILLGQEATESALLGLSTPGILHIATHGLFAEDQESLNRSRSAHSHFEEDTIPLPNHPLLRSALALAGALADPVPSDGRGDDRFDGLVTALELSGLNLWGTQLVVLSACNTGRGSVQLGQGVYGLRRALITAGAETLVTSLWKVDDESTCELMKGYYEGLRQGQGRAEAMHRAAWEMRKQHQHPYYWASFIVIGRGDPLRGTW